MELDSAQIFLAFESKHWFHSHRSRSRNAVATSIRSEPTGPAALDRGLWLGFVCDFLRTAFNFDWLAALELLYISCRDLKRSGSTTGGADFRLLSLSWKPHASQKFQLLWTRISQRGHAIKAQQDAKRWAPKLYLFSKLSAPPKPVIAVACSRGLLPMCANGYIIDTCPSSLIRPGPISWCQDSGKLWVHRESGTDSGIFREMVTYRAYIADQPPLVRLLNRKKIRVHSRCRKPVN